MEKPMNLRVRIEKIRFMMNSASYTRKNYGWNPVLLDLQWKVHFDISSSRKALAPFPSSKITRPISFLEKHSPRAASRLFSAARPRAAAAANRRGRKPPPPRDAHFYPPPGPAPRTFIRRPAPRRRALLSAAVCSEVSLTLYILKHFLTVYLYFSVIVNYIVEKNKCFR